jgi:hypothetical protein|tara:strand:+ start:3169 stop:3750 length:582 start_codon:yes stop_codon:yes gene_type:complete
LIKLSKIHQGVVIPNPLEGVVLPEWDSVNEFCKWWVSAGCPIAPPAEKVHLSDDATSFALFRSGQFQVELYLIHPNPNLPIHEHPDVEVIKMRLDSFSPCGSFVKKTTYYPASETLFQGRSHGAGINFKDAETTDSSGFGLLAFQKWREGLTPTTVAARWKGRTVGPKQEALIRKLTPEALVESGYADTTGAA